MTPGDWIALAALCCTILGATAWGVWHMATLNTSVRNLTDRLDSWETFVKAEHADMWEAIHKKQDKE